MTADDLDYNTSKELSVAKEDDDKTQSLVHSDKPNDKKVSADSKESKDEKSMAKRFLYSDGKYDYYSDNDSRYSDYDHRDYRDGRDYRDAREYRDSGAYDEADYEYENEKGVPVKRNITRDADLPRRRESRFDLDEYGRRVYYDDDLSHEQRARAAVNGRIRSGIERRVIGEDNVVRSTTSPVVSRSVRQDENGHIIVGPHPRSINRRIIHRDYPRDHVISSSGRDADRIGDVDRADRVADVDRRGYDYRDHVVRVPRGERFDYRDEEGEYREHVLPYDTYDHHEDRVRSYRYRNFKDSRDLRSPVRYDDDYYDDGRDRVPRQKVIIDREPAKSKVSTKSRKLKG